MLMTPTVLICPTAFRYSHTYKDFTSPGFQTYFFCKLSHLVRVNSTLLVLPIFQSTSLESFCTPFFLSHFNSNQSENPVIYLQNMSRITPLLITFTTKHSGPRTLFCLSKFIQQHHNLSPCFYHYIPEPLIFCIVVITVLQKISQIVLLSSTSPNTSNLAHIDN